MTPPPPLGDTFEVQKHRLAVNQAEATAKLLRATIDLTKAVERLTNIMGAIIRQNEHFEEKIKDLDASTRSMDWVSHDLGKTKE